VRIDNPTIEEKRKIFNNLDNYLENTYKKVFVKYLDLGVKVVRIINYSNDFSHLIEKQLPYVLKDTADKFDATLKVFQDDNMGLVPTKIIDEINPKTNFKFRIKMLTEKIDFVETWIFDKTYSKFNPILQCAKWNSILSAQDTETNTYYYGAKDLNPEEIIKEGHIFVQQFNKILKSDNTNLVHGASVGLDNEGILFCARGQRGKSTLAVLSMIKGFEYVSDDYLTLEKQGDELYVHPIYSIITLSPRMYNELFDELKDSRFLFNNARKDKYVVSIENFHDRFKKKYPIKLCMFPEIVSDKEPSIVLCSKEEKGRAIVQIIQSTVCQMQDMNNTKVIQKLFNMVKGFNFYKINLCSDINKNTECLREFLKNYREENKNIEPDRMLIDITFDLANIIDTKTYTIYSMNKFATSIYENLANGAAKENIIGALRTITDMPIKVLGELDTFIEKLKELELLNSAPVSSKKAYINPEFAKECGYRLSFLKYDENMKINLIKENK